jgi:hypothetical protein
MQRVCARAAARTIGEVPDRVPTSGQADSGSAFGRRATVRVRRCVFSESPSMSTFGSSRSSHRGNDHAHRVAAEDEACEAARHDDRAAVTTRALPRKPDSIERIAPPSRHGQRAKDEHQQHEREADESARASPAAPS